MPYVFHSARSDMHDYIVRDASDLAVALALASDFARSQEPGYELVAWSRVDPSTLLTSNRVGALRKHALEHGRTLMKNARGDYVAQTGIGIWVVPLRETDRDTAKNPPAPVPQLDPSAMRDRAHTPQPLPGRTPFDPFKDFVVNSADPGNEPLSSGREFGHFVDPDTRPTSPQVDPQFALAADRSR